MRPLDSPGGYHHLFLGTFRSFFVDTWSPCSGSLGLFGLHLWEDMSLSSRVRWRLEAVYLSGQDHELLDSGNLGWSFDVTIY